jgi:DNA mismatch repair protein MutL
MEERLLPNFLLFLELPSDAVDVNVHPQKREVRFRDEGQVFTWVQTAVEKALGSHVASLPPLPWDFTPPAKESSFSFVLNEAPVPIPSPAFSFSKGPKPLVLLGSLLLLESAEGWTLLDVRRAEATLLFEAMQSSQPVVQPLLCPFEWALGAHEEPEDVLSLLHKVGIEARALGKKVVGIDALPSGLDVSDLPLFLRELSGERKLASAVTKTCLASKRPLSFEKACLIWTQLQKSQNSQYDPLGRAIQTIVTEATLRSLF